MKHKLFPGNCQDPGNRLVFTQNVRAFNQILQKQILKKKKKIYKKNQKALQLKASQMSGDVSMFHTVRVSL